MKKVFTSIVAPLYEVAGLTVFYGLAYFVGMYSNFASGIILIFFGFVVYAYLSVQKPLNYLRLTAVFSGVWMVTVGFAQFRFLQYQTSWQPLTWLCVGGAHAIFHIFNYLGQRSCANVIYKFEHREPKPSKSLFVLSVRKERFFWISMILFLVGITSFVLNVMIKGYIPYFIISKYPNAYYDFYTRFQIFIVASLASAGLSFYTLKTQSLPILKRSLLWLSIFILVFVLPTLLVQRGTFLNIALIMTAVIYLGGNRKFTTLLICVVLMGSIYMFGSVLRGYSDKQLVNFFPIKEPTTPIEGEPVVEINDQLPFTLSPQTLFLYAYLTVSHDNFNSVVAHKTTDTFGIWQIRPFNVVLRNAEIERLIENAEELSKKDMVLPHLNSFNLISFAYYDFGTLGVFFFMGLWSFSFGVVEMFNKKYKGIFSSLTYGVCLIPVALGFFLPWMSDFVPWLLWGTIFLMFLASAVSLRKPLNPS